MAEPSLTGWLNHLPEDIRELVLDLLAEDLEPVPTLRHELVEYGKRVERLAEEQPYVDIDLARQLSRRCGELLDQLGRHGSEASHRLVQVAIRYLVLDTDAEADVNSIVGFEDDARVVDAVERALRALT